MAVANIAPFGKFTGLGTLGVSIPGGQLFTYLAGTTTKTNTYTTAGESTANTNPVVMDANGQANIFLDSATNYKFVFSPPTDTDPPTNPYWTVDNINPAPAVGTATSLSPGATISITGAVDLTTPVFTGAGNITAAATIQSALFTQTQASGTSCPESFTTATWTTRVLNTTVFNNIPGVSLSSNEIVFSGGAVPGVYEISADQTIDVSTPTLGNKSRFRNITTSATIIDGLNATISTAGNGLVHLQGIANLTGNTTTALQVYFGTGNGTLNGGNAATSGEQEVYVSVYVRRIA